MILDENQEAAGGGEPSDQSELDRLRQLQVAMQMREAERRARDRHMFMMAVQMAQHQAMIEEERLLLGALEESKQNQDPTRPDVDNMTYE